MSQFLIVETIAVVLCWFTLNIAITTLTKWTFVHGQICVKPNDVLVCTPYKFPLFITGVHMIFSFVCCTVFIQLRKCASGPSDDNDTARSTGKPWSYHFYKIAPLAISFAISVSSGNMALKYIFPSFTQMLGGMTPVVTVIISVMWLGKRYNKWTWIAMPIICGGLISTIQGEMNFHVLGCAFAVSATIFRAVKTIMQGELLVDPADKVDAITLLQYMAPWAGCLLFVSSLLIEGLAPILIFFPRDAFGERVPCQGVETLLALIALGGLNACFLNIANFLVTSYTSAVTLQVLGNVAGCASIALSSFILGNTVTPMQAVGVATCISGVVLYNRKGGIVTTPSEAIEIEHLSPKARQSPAVRGHHMPRDGNEEVLPLVAATTLGAPAEGGPDPEAGLPAEEAAPGEVSFHMSTAARPMDGTAEEEDDKI